LKSWPKGDRGLKKHESEILLRNTGMFIQAGSGKKKPASQSASQPAS